MKIVVLVKEVPDTYEPRALDASGRVDRAASEAVMDEVDERALEVALRYHDAHDAEVVVLSMGPSSVTTALRKGLAMGATSAVHVVDPGLAGADAARTASTLAAALRRVGFDLVVAGNESTDGRGGILPAMVAEHLGVPHATYLESVEIAADRVRGVRTTESGTATVSAALPAVVSVTEGVPEARFPKLKGVMTAKRKPLQVWSLADLEIDRADAGSVVLTVDRRPPRAAGTTIVDDGSSGELLADFLAASRLI